MSGDFREVAEAGAEPISEFEFSPNEFDVRRMNTFKSGIISSALDAGADDIRKPEEERLEQMAFAMEMLGFGLTGEAFDAQMVVLPGGRRATLGQLRWALNRISSDFDRHVAEAQAAGILPKDLSQADKDRIRGEVSDATAVIEEARQTGSGVPAETLARLSPEAMGLIGMQLEPRPAAAPAEPGTRVVHAAPAGL